MPERSERRPTPDIRERSGSVDSDDALVVFLYLLARETIPTGEVERLARQAAIVGRLGAEFSNGWLAEWAKDVAARLTATEATDALDG